MIYIGADHGGYVRKEELKFYLGNAGYELEDCGAYDEIQDDDYPDFVIPVAKKVAQNPDSRGIVIGRSGNGEAIVANKIKGVRAALCTNVEMAKKAREHNDANVLSLGADYTDHDRAREIAMAFLETPFSQEERHKRRLEKIAQIEK